MTTFLDLLFLFFIHFHLIYVDIVVTYVCFLFHYLYFCCAAMSYD